MNLKIAKDARTPPFSPETLEDVFESIRAVAKATGTEEAAHQLMYTLRLRATEVQKATYFLKPKPRVFVLEWLDPFYGAGHWVRDMVDIAGGILPPAVLTKSTACRWEDIERFNPDVLILAPYGYHLEDVRREAALLINCPNRDRINAFKAGRVYAVDADAYVTRPGPRVVDGIELLAHLFHPLACPWTGPADAFCRLAT